MVRIYIIRTVVYRYKDRWHRVTGRSNRTHCIFEERGQDIFPGAYWRIIDCIITCSTFKENWNRKRLVHCNLCSLACSPIRIRCLLPYLLRCPLRCLSCCPLMSSLWIIFWIRCWDICHGHSIHFLMFVSGVSSRRDQCLRKLMYWFETTFNILLISS